MNYSHRKIASILNCSKGTVSGHVRRNSRFRRQKVERCILCGHSSVRLFLDGKDYEDIG